MLQERLLGPVRMEFMVVSSINTRMYLTEARVILLNFILR